MKRLSLRKLASLFLTLALLIGVMPLSAIPALASTTGPQTEHFTGKSGTSFSSGSFTYSLTGNLSIANVSSLGWTGTATDDYYIETPLLTDAGMVGAIQVPAGYSFQAKSLFLFPSEDTFAPSNAGTVEIKGSLGGTEKFCISVESINTEMFSNNGWTFVDLSSYSSYFIDKLEFTLTGALRYLAIDAFAHEGTQGLPPADVSLSANTVSENAPSGTAVGTLSSTDPNVGDTFFYSLVSGTGSTDNASFTIVGSELRTAAVFDYETKTSYSIRIRSTDSTGAYYEQAFTVSVSDVPATAPDAPTIGTATAGNESASVSFTAPANNGDATITSYTVTSSPGGFTGTGTSSPITVTGLTNGTSYTFTVTATNSAGTSAASAASNSVTPKASQTITFANPGAQNFDTSPILTASSDSSLTVTFTSKTPDVCTITSGGALTFLKAGTAAIVAHQAGNDSFLPAEDVEQSFDVNAVAPGAPAIGTATAGNKEATVSFTAPASTGGLDITKYTVTSNPGGFTATGTLSPITVTGLTNGTSYTFTVTATNGVDTGAASAASNSVTPKTSQVITFANPGDQNFGTSPTLTATSDSYLTVTFTSDTPDVCTITSGGALTFLKAGTATITAHQAGNSSYLPAADVSQTFTVNAVVPGAPTACTATVDSGGVTVNFTAPASSGGADIISYTVTASPGGKTATGTESPITVTGLTSGTTYTFTVTAKNSVGTGPSSSASNAVTPTTSQTITFSNPGAQLFGTSPTLTATSSSGLTVSFTSDTPTVCTITSGGALTFLKAGTATITAHQAGNASYSPAEDVSQTFTVNAVAPDAPMIGTATAGSASATVSFTAPDSTGGADIISYTVTAYPGGITATGTASPITVTGLTSGTPYTFTVTAKNSAGTGAASAASNSVTPVAISSGSIYVAEQFIVAASGNVIVDLTKGSSILSADQANRLIALNREQPIVISGSGYTITFPKGSMSSSGGRSDYDLGLSFDTGSEFPQIKSLAGNGFIRMLNFNHSGSLPGTAKIRVYVGAQYAGQKLQYNYYNPQTGTLRYMQAATVDASGYVTISQSHCSSYVFTLYGTSGINVPQTGDSVSALVWLLCGVSAMGTVAMLILRKKNKANCCTRAPH